MVNVEGHSVQMLTGSSTGLPEGSNLHRITRSLSQTYPKADPSLGAAPPVGLALLP